MIWKDSYFKENRNVRKFSLNGLIVKIIKLWFLFGWWKFGYVIVVNIGNICMKMWDLKCLKYFLLKICDFCMEVECIFYFGFDRF